MPYFTRYSVTQSVRYEVLDVSAVLYRPPLVMPPTFLEPPVNRKPYYILADDIYEAF